MAFAVVCKMQYPPTTGKALMDTHRGSNVWVITHHAAERMHEMQVVSHEVRHALAQSELDYCTYPGGGGDPRRIAVAGRLAVVYSPARGTVVTVTWHLQESRFPAAA